MVPGLAPVASNSRSLANRFARRRRVQRQQAATAVTLALHDVVSFVDSSSEEPGAVFQHVDGSWRADRARVASLWSVVQERVVSNTATDRAARSVSRTSAVTGVLLSEASQTDFPGPAKGDPGLDAETQQRVAVLDGMMLVANQAGWFFFVSGAVVPVVRMHD